MSDMAEHRPILKNTQNTKYPCFIFTPKRDVELPKIGVPFLLRLVPYLLTLFICLGKLVLHSPFFFLGVLFELSFCHSS